MDALRENRSALDARGVDHCAALPVVSLDACERARSPAIVADRAASPESTPDRGSIQGEGNKPLQGHAQGAPPGPAERRVADRRSKD